MSFDFDQYRESVNRLVHFQNAIEDWYMSHGDTSQIPVSDAFLAAVCVLAQQIDIIFDQLTEEELASLGYWRTAPDRGCGGFGDCALLSGHQPGQTDAVTSDFLESSP